MAVEGGESNPVPVLPMPNHRPSFRTSTLPFTWILMENA